MQALVAAGTIGEIAFVGKFERLIDKADWTTLGLLLISVTHLLAHLQEWQGHGISADKQIAHVGCQPCHKVTTIEALLQHFVEEEKTIRHAMGKEVVNKLEVILLTQDIQVLANTLVSQVPAREADHLVEDGERIAHAAISLLGNEGKGFRLCRIALLLSHIHQVVDGVLRGHPLEVIDLTTA